MKKFRLYLIYLVLDKKELLYAEIQYIKPYREELPNEDNENERFTETIYAVSDNKNDVNDFLSFRNKKKFRIEKIDFDSKNELDKAKLEYTDILIREDTISFKKIELPLITNTNEKGLIEEFVSEFLESLSSVVCSEYRGFKQEYIKALEVIMYTYFYSTLGADDDELQEVAEYNMGFGLSPEGYVRNSKFNYNILDFTAFTHGVLNYLIK